MIIIKNVKITVQLQSNDHARKALEQINNDNAGDFNSIETLNNKLIIILNNEGFEPDESVFTINDDLRLCREKILETLENETDGVLSIKVETN